ncbi:MAG: S9 family peptidase, partial [Bacteroidales bacterium]|nr:S9 family peptidase [Bacteroidales bacterium]
KTERVSFGDYDFRGVRISEDSRRITAVASNSTTPEMEVEITLPNYLPADKARIKVLHDTKGPEFDKYRIATQEIVPIRLRGGDTIPVAVIWPFDMDRSGKVKYPVKIDIYGGPDSQQVYDRFRGVGFNTQWWANHGVVQITLETRSAGHLGKEGLNSVYRCLGVHELEDFVDEMKYFASLPYIDSKRVGIEGYSYGGTMALLAVTEANEWFQYGIASAGVMDWSLYDTHYAERYMDRPQDNPEGYRQSRVMERISKYRGDDTNMLRITHGSGDDNVHFQQSLQIIDELQKQNKDFELMVYPGGMHGYRGAQQRHFTMQNFRFWYKYLLGEELPEILKNR